MKKIMRKVTQVAETIAKRGLIRNKMMLGALWDWKGNIHYELCPPGKTFDCQQLMRLRQKIENKRSEVINRKGVVFQQDSDRPQTFLAT